MSNSSTNQPDLQQEQSQASLGIYTDTVGPLLQKAILKQDLLSAAKELLPNEKRLQACLALRVDVNQPVGLDYADNTETPKARLTNVCRCDNPHFCPKNGYSKSLGAGKSMQYTGWEATRARHTA